MAKKLKLFQKESIIVTFKMWVVYFISSLAILIFSVFIEPESWLGLIILFLYLIFSFFFVGWLARKMWGWK